MSEVIRVVVRYMDGRVVKGTTEDFFPNRPIFHIRPVGASATEDVQCRHLKAVFFVKDFAGDPKRRDAQGFLEGPAEANRGRRIAVRFKDGELVCGYTLAYTPDRSGFFMEPSDPETNNIRIYVLTQATQEVKLGPAADALLRRAQAHRAA